MALPLAGLSLVRAASVSARASRSIGLCASTSMAVTHEAPAFMDPVTLMQRHRMRRRMTSSPSFHKEADETLEELQMMMEQKLDAYVDVSGGDGVEVADVELSQGVLTVIMPQKKGVFVVNKQSPNRQLWLSSPVSGPSRFEFSPLSSAWKCVRSDRELSSAIESEVEMLLAGTIMKRK